MLEPNDMRIVMMSRRRSAMCERTATVTAPSATIVVAEAEADDYAWAAAAGRLVLHPDPVDGIGAVRYWILQHFTDRCVVVMNDDITRVSCLVGRRPRTIVDPGAIWQVIYQAGLAASDAGASCFSFAITANLLDFPPQDPWGFTKANGPCLGFIGRRILPEPSMTHYTDADITLEALLRDRFVWMDRRYCFDHQWQNAVGGATHLHSASDSDRNRAVLKRKWGSQGGYWDVQPSGGRTRVVTKVQRRQALEL